LGIKELYFAATTKLPDVNEKYFDIEWYKANIQQPLRQVIVRTSLVDTVSHGRCAIEDSKGAYVDFPHHDTKKVRERLWTLGNKLNGSTLMLPEKSSVDFWDEIIWDKKYYLDLEQYAKFFMQWSKNVADFGAVTGENQNAFEWLNEFYNLIIDEEKSELFNQFELVPNQNGNFKKVNERTNYKITNILFNDEIKDETLLEILQLLGNDWKEYLIHSEVKTVLTNAVLKKQDIASTISKTFSDYKGDWSANAVKAIILLTEWFEYNSELGKELFPDLYRRRAELFMNTIEDKESLYQVMKSKTPLATLSEIALAIENDPEILNIIAKRQQEMIEEKERNEIGEAVESILAEVLRDSGFTVQKTHVGRDLIISLNGRFSYDVEVKSTNTGGFVSMTPTQAQTAVDKQNNYALCVVHKNGQHLTKEYVRANAKFVVNIGALVAAKVSSMNSFNSNQWQLFSSNEDIGLLLENSLNYKYKINQNVWLRGVDIEAFVQLIKK
ncbi:MAG: hypothetical protein JNK41_00770, partial [Saprospiraceae bacterium]|nr:hypothetical protein [Saprospiraceae bacterium]